jgi:hypothetical protein
MLAGRALDGRGALEDCMQLIFKTACVLLLASTLWGQLQSVNLQSTDQVDAVAIVVTRFGPYPAAITHSQMPFLLCVVNRSGILEDTFSLLLKPAVAANPAGAAASLLDLHSTSSRQRDSQLIKAFPGNYQLVFKSHPDWVVNITITAN